MNFPAQPPHLHRLPLVVRASWFRAQSLWLAAPLMRFLFVGSRFRYRFFQCWPRSQTGFHRLLHLANRSGSLRPASPEDFHLQFMPMLGTHNKAPKLAPGGRFVS